MPLLLGRVNKGELLVTYRRTSKRLYPFYFAKECTKDPWRKTLHVNMKFALANWSLNRQKDGIEEHSEIVPQESDEESEANGVQYEEDSYINIGIPLLSEHLESGFPNPMKISDT